TQDRLRGSTSLSTIDTDNRTVADSPSTRLISYQGRDFSIRYPSNWRVSEEGDVVNLAPSGAVVSGELAYGMRIAVFEPQGTGFFGQNSLNSPGAGTS